MDPNPLGSHRFDGARSSKPLRSKDAAMVRALSVASSKVWAPRLKEAESNERLRSEAKFAPTWSCGMPGRLSAARLSSSVDNHALCPLLIQPETWSRPLPTKPDTLRMHPEALLRGRSTPESLSPNR